MQDNQDDDIDILNGTLHGTGSCFPVLERFAREQEAVFEPVLLPDFFPSSTLGGGNKDREPFETFGKIKMRQSSRSPKIVTMNKSKPQEFFHAVESTDNQVMFYDDHKILQILAQLQHIAQKNPDKEIEFHFFDDRNDILTGLKDFFTKYSQVLLPKNIKLHLHQYQRVKGDLSQEELKKRLDGQSITCIQIVVGYLKNIQAYVPKTEEFSPTTTGAFLK